MGVAGLETQYKELDGQIESLMKCTPLPEAEVKALCDKAREILQVILRCRLCVFLTRLRPARKRHIALSQTPGAVLSGHSLRA